MDDFVTVTLTEDEFDAVVEWIGNESINSGLAGLYQKLLDAVEERDDVESPIEDEE